MSFYSSSPPHASHRGRGGYTSSGSTEGQGNRGRGRGRGGRGSWYERITSAPPTHNLKPSQEYLQLVASPQHADSTPSPPRKLFILSLGSTLTLRTSNRNSVLLRAYIPVFMRYVTHPETKKWADVMVWSAAARRNVEPGVRKVLKDVIEDRDSATRMGSHGGSLGGRAGYGIWGVGVPARAATGGSDGKPFWEGLLFDVWSQETIARLQGRQNEPVVHTPAAKPKDLSLAWTPSSFSHLGTGSSRSETEKQTHSAHTTLLLDDTPTIDCLPQHPYNHLRVGTFDKEVRNRDLLVTEREILNRTSSIGSGRTTTARIDDDDEGLPDLGKLSLSEKTQHVTSGDRSVSSQTQGQEEWKGPGYDVTLLAVIGIFEEMKQQESIAVWLKNDGLRCVGGGQESADVGRAGHEEPDVGDESGTKDEEPEDNPEKISVAVGNGVRTVATSDSGINEHNVSRNDQYEVKREVSESEPAREQGGSVSSGGLRIGAVRDDAKEKTTTAWYEDEKNLRRWAAKGREVCRGLGIDPDDDGVMHVAF